VRGRCLGLGGRLAARSRPSWLKKVRLACRLLTSRPCFSVFVTTAAPTEKAVWVGGALLFRGEDISTQSISTLRHDNPAAAGMVRWLST